MTATDTLREMYALIEDPEHWTQSKLARDANGNSCSPCSAKARKWCLVGAWWRTGGEGMPLPVPALDLALAKQGATSPDDFNDTHTHAEVLGLLRDAIQYAETKPWEAKS